MSYSFVDQAIQAYSDLGRLAVIVELKMRILANKISEIEHTAFCYSISETASTLLPYLIKKGLITDEESTHLISTNKIRNKILHCEFEAAIKVIEKLIGEKLPSGGVSGMKLNDLEGDGILEKILNGVTALQKKQSTKGTFRVSEITTKEAGIFGWLLEAYSSGLLSEGLKIIQRSLGILDRVLENIDMA